MSSLTRLSHISDQSWQVTADLTAFVSSTGLAFHVGGYAYTNSYFSYFFLNPRTLAGYDGLLAKVFHSQQTILAKTDVSLIHPPEPLAQIGVFRERIGKMDRRQTEPFLKLGNLVSADHPERSEGSKSKEA